MDSGDVTRALNLLSQGSKDAEAQLIEIVYEELKRIAARHLRREPAGHTLQPTALVHEAYFRLIGKTDITWENRAHFFATAATVMRNILVDHARASRAQKRGSGAVQVDLGEVIGASDSRIEEILAVDQVLDRLNDLSPRQRTIVEMRFYGGLTEEEIGAVLHLGSRTIRREWAVAKAWLHAEMKSARALGDA
jgi:RNA polymerase sigma factor (TIGR02999 family)